MGAKRSNISPIKQAGFINKIFPNGKFISKRDSGLSWVGDITPSANSLTYTVKVQYSLADGAKVYVINPNPLPLADGKTHLPHVYSHNKQRLCLYYPGVGEWNRSDLLVDTIFPWISEWLLHYELWLITGEWLGGGIHHNIDNKREAKDND